MGCRYFIRSKVFWGASVNGYQLFVIWKRRKRAAVRCELSVIRYLLSGKREETRQKKDCDYWFAERNARRCLTARQKEERERENRPLLFAGNAARGEPVAHRGVFGRRGRAPFGEFLALFRQQFH